MRFTAVLLMALFSVSVHAFVTVDTTREWASPPGLHEDIADAIADGVWDARHLRFAIEGAGKSLPANSVVRENGRRWLVLSAKSFRALPQKAKARVVADLADGYRWAPNYRVTVKTADNDLEHEPVIQRLKAPLETFFDVVPAEQLLSAYAQTWAYKSSAFDGPNCWHSSIASINAGWERHRYMRPEEFACHVRTSFEQISAPSQWGDLIRLSDSSGEVHGFTFLGKERGTGRWIVFTKNGYRRSYYLFMDYQSVLGVYYYASPTFYRARGEIADPASDATAPCVTYYAKNAPVRESLEDPIIAAGLRRRDTRTLPALLVD